VRVSLTNAAANSKATLNERYGGIALIKAVVATVGLLTTLHEKITKSGLEHILLNYLDAA
jgi:hypothetical protein